MYFILDIMCCIKKYWNIVVIKIECVILFVILYFYIYNFFYMLNVKVIYNDFILCYLRFNIEVLLVMDLISRYCLYLFYEFI